MLEEIARVTRGQVDSVDRLEQIVESLAALPDPPPAVRRLQLWCHPIVALMLVGLLGVFLDRAKDGRIDVNMRSSVGVDVRAICTAVRERFVP